MHWPRRGGWRRKGGSGRRSIFWNRRWRGGHQTAEVCKELARLCLSVDEVRAFQNWCHEALRIDPSDPEPGLMIARVFVAGGRWEEAIEGLESALRLGLKGTDREEAERLMAEARQRIAGSRD